MELSYGEQVMGIDFTSDEIGDDVVLLTYAANMINYIVELRGEPVDDWHLIDRLHIKSTAAIDSIRYGALLAIDVLGLSAGRNELWKRHSDRK